MQLLLKHCAGLSDGWAFFLDSVASCVSRMTGTDFKLSVKEQLFI